ncbi:MAG: DUF3786 domain-containing protein [bacterium]|nr:DUF3786 domain-containing protein [bacterium]
MEAFTIAIQKLKKISPEEIANNSGCQFDKQKNFILVFYLNNVCSINVKDFSFAEETFLNSKEKILILHYLANSGNFSETGKLISFSELDAGSFYKPSIESRVYNPITAKYGSSPQEFLNRALLFGTYFPEFGEFSVKITVFPKIHVSIVFYPADDEFPATCKMLFDSGIKNVFDTEDIVVMCEEITEKIVS